MLERREVTALLIRVGGVGEQHVDRLPDQVLGPVTEHAAQLRVDRHHGSVGQALRGADRRAGEQRAEAAGGLAECRLGSGLHRHVAQFHLHGRFAEVCHRGRVDLDRYQPTVQAPQRPAVTEQRGTARHQGAEQRCRGLLVAFRDELRRQATDDLAGVLRAVQRHRLWVGVGEAGVGPDDRDGDR